MLILWDIDGTLLVSGGAGLRALETGLKSGFGIDAPLAEIDIAGRTDLWIIRQIFSKFMIENSSENRARLIDAYIEALPGALANPSARVLEGVREILLEAETRGCAQGLLTGNLHRGARVKLSHHGLWGHFPFGAFADDSESRDELGPHALRRAASHWGIDFSPKSVWIVGDTPHDIACARAIGAKALAVSTGVFTADELARHRPDALLPNLADRSAFWRIVTDPA